MLQARTASYLLCFVHSRTLTCCLGGCEFAVRLHDSGNEMVEIVESGVSSDFFLHQLTRHLKRGSAIRPDQLLERLDELKQMGF